MLHALAAIAIEQQYEKPLLAAALDHEEQRLPLAPRLRQAEQRLGSALAGLLQAHRAELRQLRPLPGVVHDLLIITKALVEADAQAGRTPSADLGERIVRAQRGCLHAPALQAPICRAPAAGR